VGAGAAWTVAGPALMTFLLVKVSGVALLERSLAKGRPGYAEYVRRTSAFLPWFPRD
jgi:steroid 5-alpha reductase family enzyme